MAFGGHPFLTRKKTNKKESKIKSRNVEWLRPRRPAFSRTRKDGPNKELLDHW